MEEMLQVQNEINDIQEEIESATGRINYLSGASAMSTIQLTFYQVLNATAKDSNGMAFWGKLRNAFLSGWNGLINVMIGVIYIWPLIVGAMAVLWVTKRFYSSKKSRQHKQENTASNSSGK